MKQTEIKEIVTLNNYPEWVKENDALNNMLASEQKIKERINDLLSTRAMNHSKRRDIISEQAQAMLNGKTVGLIDDTVELDLEKAYHKQKVIKKAIELQKQKINAAQGEASVKACKKLKAEYERRVNEIAKAMIVLENAAQLEHELRTDITAGGLSFRMRAMPLNRLGFINAEYGDAFILRWLKEADEYGLVDKKKVMKLSNTKEWVAEIRKEKPQEKRPPFVPMEFIKALSSSKKAPQATKRLVERRL